MIAGSCCCSQHTLLVLAMRDLFDGFLVANSDVEPAVVAVVFPVASVFWPGVTPLEAPPFKGIEAVCIIFDGRCAEMPEQELLPPEPEEGLEVKLAGETETTVVALPSDSSATFWTGTGSSTCSSTCSSDCFSWPSNSSLGATNSSLGAPDCSSSWADNFIGLPLLKPAVARKSAVSTAVPDARGLAVP